MNTRRVSAFAAAMLALSLAASGPAFAQIEETVAVPVIAEDDGFDWGWLGLLGLIGLMGLKRRDHRDRDVHTTTHTGTTTGTTGATGTTGTTGTGYTTPR